MPPPDVQPSPTAAPHKALTEFYGHPEARADFLRGLFDRTARHYDQISAVMSFGTDRQYRKYALQRAGLASGMRLLDVASGTGLVVTAALELGIAVEQVIGLDPSLGMLVENQKRNRVRLVRGRGEELPFPDATFDFISMGYGLRHVEDLLQLFREFRRVLRPGGRVLILEITRPQKRWAFCMLSFYMRRVVPLVARIISRNESSAELMRYYWATIAECVAPQIILDSLRASGFGGVARRVCGPILSEYQAQKA